MRFIYIQNNGQMVYTFNLNQSDKQNSNDNWQYNISVT